MGNLGPGTKFTFENLGTHLKAQESAWLTDSKKKYKKRTGPFLLFSKKRTDPNLNYERWRI